MKLKRLLTLATYLIITGSTVMAKDYTVSSPNGKLSVTVGDDLQMTVYHQGMQIFTVSSQLVSNQGTANNCKFLSKKRCSNNILSPFYRQSSFLIKGNELDFSLGNGLGW